MERVVLCLLLVGLCFSHAYGQDEEGELLSFLDDWSFKITRYFWWANEDGDITASDESDGFEFESSLDISDLASITAFEAWKGDWGFAGYWLSADFEDDIEKDGKIIEQTIEPWILDVSFGYRFAEFPMSDRVGPDWLRNISLYAGAGLRYWDVTTEIDFLGDGRTISVEDQWVEPFLNAMMRFPVSSKLILSSNLGVGGFGIGNSDDLSWHFAIGGEYLFSKYLSLSLSYVAFDSSFEVQSGTEKVSVDADTSGLALALVFRF